MNLINLNSKSKEDNILSRLDNLPEIRRILVISALSMRDKLE
jgi:hypothetical protein